LTVSTYRFGDLALTGVSIAGDQTWFRLHPPGIAFDVGRGATELSGIDRVFLTHGHLDHALGLPFLLSQRVARGASPLQVFAPRPLVAALDEFVRAAERLEERRYALRLVGLDEGERVELGAGFAVQAFAAAHRNVAFGYHLFRTKRRLKPELAGWDGERLAALRAAGHEIEVESDERWLSYTGDTTAEVFDRAPEILDATVLLIECTFLLDRHHEHARLFGHLHLDDLARWQDRFRNQSIVLAHLSRRHRIAELEAAVSSRLPLLAGRVHVFGGSV
jgi:ribonuclease Z